MPKEHTKSSNGGATAIWVAIISALSAIIVAIINNAEPPPVYKQAPPDISYKWEKGNETISVIYAKGCQDSSRWSGKLTAGAANVGKKVYIAAPRYKDKELLLKEGEDGSFSHGYGLGKQIKFSDNGKTITWSGARGNCGYDEAVQINATVYTCKENITEFEPELIEPVGFWKVWANMKEAIFDLFKRS